MKIEHPFISSDSHVNPDPAIWRDRLPQDLRSRAPRVEDRKDGQYVLFEGSEQKISALSDAAGRKPGKMNDPVRDVRKEFKAGGWDAEVRLRDMERDSVVAEVLYGGTYTFQTPDLALRFALTRAYNDWLAELCAHCPERLIGIAEIPSWDMDLAVAEVLRARELGHRGILIPAIPTLEGPWSTPADRPYTDPFWEPLWSVLEETEMSANMHLGTRPITRGLTESSLLSHIVCNKAMMAEPIASVIFSGALQRHPKLKLVSVEGGIGWMAFVVEFMDRIFQRHREWQNSPLKELPSHYFHRQVYGTFMEDVVGLRERELIGIQNIMWASDYPHADSTWPNSRKSLEEQMELAEVSAEDVYRIVFGNAADLYRIAADLISSAAQ
ncbi:MAG TPA: amidohydrolase family protein [Myxococcota bacterium]|nr:amidohydrolase family protein [Myxococcota bacterium]MDP7297968.1 amidohydrolase family protein [Myxococcota bacterium]HJO23046.1 amidohydrolase family protein [Myxococcota bacterium]